MVEAINPPEFISHTALVLMTGDPSLTFTVLVSLRGEVRGVMFILGAAFPSRQLREEE